jgi:hypothetical protein
MCQVAHVGKLTRCLLLTMTSAPFGKTEIKIGMTMNWAEFAEALEHHVQTYCEQVIEFNLEMMKED